MRHVLGRISTSCHGTMSKGLKVTGSRVGSELALLGKSKVPQFNGSDKEKSHE
jgi:hypothetical protein